MTSRLYTQFKIGLKVIKEILGVHIVFVKNFQTDYRLDIDKNFESMPQAPFLTKRNCLFVVARENIPIQKYRTATFWSDLKEKGDCGYGNLLSQSGIFKQSPQP